MLNSIIGGKIKSKVSSIFMTNNSSAVSFIFNGSSDTDISSSYLQIYRSLSR